MDGGKKTGSLLMMISMALQLQACQGTNPNYLAQKKSGETLARQSVEQAEVLPIDHHKAALVNVELGLGYLAQGQVARAKTKLTHALKLAPDLSESHAAMAYFLERTGEISRAEEEHKKAMKLGKEKGAVYNNYGAFLCRQARLKEADKAFKEALRDKNYARTAEVYENAGICALKSNNTPQAEMYFLNALRHDPKRTQALLELTALDLKQNKLEAAEQKLVQFKQVAEPQARSLWLGIQVSHRLKDKQSVDSQAQLLKELFQDSPEYQEFLQSKMGNS